MDNEQLTYEQLASKLRDDWFKPFRDVWDDPAMDIYDEVYSDRPTPSAIDTHYTDCAQLAQWRREREG